MLHKSKGRHVLRPQRDARHSKPYAAAVILAGFATVSAVAVTPASAAPAAIAAKPTTLLTQPAIQLAMPTPAPAPAPEVVDLLSGASTAAAGSHQSAALRAPALVAQRRHAVRTHAKPLRVVRGHRLTAAKKPHHHHHHVSHGAAGAHAGIPYVGPYSPAELTARMHLIMARNGTGGNLDPFFGSEPDGSWYRDCQHFVANLDGRPSSGYSSAGAAWYHFLATGAAHPAYAAEGMNPPAGAWLYFGDNHVVVYLGHHMVAGTDTWGEGTAKIGPEGDVTRWLAFEGGYKGWVAPWGG